MTKRFLIVVVVVGLAAARQPAALRRSDPAAPPADIKLVLLIAVDQFRADYLTRFDSEYKEGFRRLLTDGAVFTSAKLEHYPTVTAIGHSTMLTGAIPADSGIIGNDWYDRQSATTVTSVSDTSVQVVGGSATAGTGASPRRLLVSTVADELKMARTRPGAEVTRVIGISLKDRAAILPGRPRRQCRLLAGHDVRCLHHQHLLSAASCRRGSSPSTSGNSRFVCGEDMDACGGEADRTAHHAGKIGGPLYTAVFGSPFGNELLLALATETLAQEKLGQRGVTDLFTVSFSANDSVGHKYGPESPEVRDITVKTDAVIGRLLAEVDKRVGLAHTLVMFTSDHGVAPMPETMTERHMPGGRADGPALFDAIQQRARSPLRCGQVAARDRRHGPVSELRADDREEGRSCRGPAASRLRRRSRLPAAHVSRVYTRDQLLRAEIADDVIGRRVLRGFNSSRSGDLEIVLEPYWIRGATGTTHGTPYNYDAAIPLILMGPGVMPGRYAGPWH